jgi:hypothetical protein
LAGVMLFAVVHQSKDSGGLDKTVGVFSPILQRAITNTCMILKMCFVLR